MKPNKLKIEFICGTTYNAEGNLLGLYTVEIARRETEQLLLNQFGGFSQLTVVGAWRSPSGKVAKDVSIVYTVLTTEAVATESTLDEIQARLMAHFQQESVPYVVTPIFCKF